MSDSMAREQRVSVDIGDEFPTVLAFPHEIGDLMALSDAVSHDGRHPFVAKGFGPHLNGHTPALLLKGIGKPIEVSGGQVVEGLTSVWI